MATQIFAEKRAALYLIVQPAVAYVAPTPATDKALRVEDVTIAFEGGVVRVEADVSAVGGGQPSYVGATSLTITGSVRLPAWPGTQPHTLAEFPAFAALLQSMPLAFDATSELDVTPVDTYIPGTTPKLISVTMITPEGNTWTGFNATSILDAIESNDDGTLRLRFTMRAQGRNTLTDTCASSTVAAGDIVYTASNYIISKGGTLTLSGPANSGVVALRSFTWSAGMAQNVNRDILAAQGYGVAFGRHTQNCAFALTITTPKESDRALVAAMLGNTGTTCALSFGSGASAFSITQAAGAISEITMGADEGAQTYALTAVAWPTATGFDQYRMRWGTP